MYSIKSNTKPNTIAVSYTPYVSKNISLPESSFLDPIPLSEDVIQEITTPEITENPTEISTGTSTETQQTQDSGLNLKWARRTINKESEEPVETQSIVWSNRQPQVKTGNTNFAKQMENAYKNAGVPDEYIPYLVAKDALESADGNSRLSSKYHNYGGVKATKNRDSVEFDTNEYINGKMQVKKEKFSVFKSADDYARYMKQLLSNSKYDVFNYDPSQLFNRLVEGGYATDPEYVKKLEDRYKQLYS